MTKKEFQRRMEIVREDSRYVCNSLNRVFGHTYVSDSKATKLYLKIMGGRDNECFGLFGFIVQDGAKEKREMSKYFFELVVIEHKLYKEL